MRAHEPFGADGALDVRIGGRPPFLETSRASLICTREFESLTSEIEERILALDAEQVGATAEVRRSPGRCIVQLGPVGLTVSWLRDSSGHAAAGRLFIVEWDGQVGRGRVANPERGMGSERALVAKPIREQVMVPAATCEEDWRWCSEEKGRSPGARSADLAKRCVDSLVATLARKVS